MWLKSYHFPKEWPGAHYLEPSNLILDLCPGIFTERFIFRLSFAGNRLLELTWVIWSMKCEEKYGSPIRGRLHIKTTQIPPFFCCIPVFQSFLPLYIPVSFTNFSYSRKKIRRSADHLCIFICICIFFFIFVCIKGHLSSDSGPSKENFLKRVQIQVDEEAICQRWWGARKQETAWAKLCASCLHLKNLHPHSL